MKTNYCLLLFVLSGLVLTFLMIGGIQLVGEDEITQVICAKNKSPIRAMCQTPEPNDCSQ
ncbi:MAG: hypothetical protein LBU65_15995 [Planctomycetaceae bacterium]|nr:hypothetical protein [Planctomycetaceae bacterium]